MDNTLDLTAEQLHTLSTIDWLRLALQRYTKSRKYEPSSASARHLAETGHELRFGCCSVIHSDRWPSAEAPALERLVAEHFPTPEDGRGAA